MILTNTQKHTYDALRLQARYFFSHERKLEEQLPAKIRSNTLIVGPSGAGKTHMLEMLSSELKLPLFRLNVAGWIPLGAKGDAYTWASVAKFIHENDQGILFVDEFDKINAGEDWLNYIRLEIHDLLDKMVPPSVNLAEFDPNAKSDWFDPDEATDDFVEKFTLKFKDKFLIIGAGAWQSCWNEHGGSMGFNSDTDSVDSELNEDQIAEMVSPELRRRFRSEILFIPALTEDDYLGIIEELAQKIQTNVVDDFTEQALEAIPRALDSKLQFRVLEEIYANACQTAYLQQQKGGAA